MNSVLGLGKYLFAIPFLGFAYGHLTHADMMAGMAFGQTWLVYLTGIALVAATVSMLIGKYDKLATTLLGVMLLIFVFTIHLKPAMEGNMGMLLKDTMLAGASWIYAKYVAKDNSIIG